MKYDITPFEFDEKVDLEHHKAWFLDATHSVPPWTPMFAWSWINFCRHGMQWGAEKLSLPTCKGWDWRLKDGGGYLALLIVDDPEEIKAREKEFRRQLIPFIQDYEGVYESYNNELIERYDVLRDFDVHTASNIALLEHFDALIDVNKRMWEIHMYLMYLVFGVYILFENMCKELLNIDDTHSDFHALMRGFDNKVFQDDKRMWELSRMAEEGGFKDIFTDLQPKEYLPALQAREEAQEWLKQLNEFIWERGWRSNRMSEFNMPSWVEDVTPALVNIRHFVKKGSQFDLDLERKKLVQEREEMEKTVLEKILPEQREWFKTIMELAQKSSSFSEEHNILYEFYTHALMRRALMEWGKRFKEAGAVNEVDDVLFIIPDEIRKAAIMPTHCNLKPIVEDRRREWGEWCQKDNPPMIGTLSMEEAMGLMIKSNDPIVLKVVVGSFPVPRPELKADLYGVPGSPGVAEGPARVILNDEDLAKVQEGEVLVAPATYPTWTPVFSLLKGVVVDRGASLSHAAIVGREYNIPVVMNVFVGTKQIRNGQRVRVDGNLGVVYLLED
ncbi:MAG: PEP-utilizing enzyme [Bacillota bacterium]|nr:PEP-utilizing enzyme [Bacillota bacterium]